ncbi:MAG: hypothetical protein Q4D26_11015 [Clostridia bacterium]|nr:hypothetical protein [Clostridia bacterium]
MPVNRQRKVQVHFWIDDVTLKILKGKLKSRELSLQDFFLKKIKEPLKYIPTEHRLEMQKCNRELNTLGKKINNIGTRIINENIYDSDITSIQDLICDIINCQNELNNSVNKYFERTNYDS